MDERDQLLRFLGGLQSTALIINKTPEWLRGSAFPHTGINIKMLGKPITTIIPLNKASGFLAAIEKDIFCPNSW